MCRNCGGIRFLPREKLTPEQLVIAERTDFSDVVPGRDGFLFCTRCLYPTRLPDARA